MGNRLLPRRGAVTGYQALALANWRSSSVPYFFWARIITVPAMPSTTTNGREAPHSGLNGLRQHQGRGDQCEQATAQTREAVDKGLDFKEELRHRFGGQFFERIYY